MTTKNDKTNSPNVAKASKQLFKPAFGVLVDGSNPDDGAIPPVIQRVATKKLQAD